MHQQAFISPLRGIWEQHAKIIRHRQLQVSGRLMLTVEKSLFTWSLLEWVVIFIRFHMNRLSWRWWTRSDMHF